jgi:hypothetical protein
LSHRFGLKGGYMKRIEFQALSRMRADEGKCLLDAGLYAGSYYLTGYSVECGLKAVIAKNCERYQFPDKGFATACNTHDLRVLIKLAGLQSAFVETMDFSGAFRENWEAVSEWSEVARYRTLVSANKAQCLYLACAGKPKGVLAWIEQYW